MLLRQDIEGARAEKIGTHGVKKAALDDALARSEAALTWLREAHEGSTLPLLRLPAKTSDLDEITQNRRQAEALARPMSCFSAPAAPASAGRRWRSSAMSACAGWKRSAPAPRVHFMDNLDPVTYAGLLAKLPLATTRFVAISKSGGTGETLMQTAAALAAVKAAGLEKKTAEIFFGISETPKRRQSERPARPARRLRAVHGA